MLINSIGQCNQLLWEQQREINNLNNAVYSVCICYYAIYVTVMYHTHTYADPD